MFGRSAVLPQDIVFNNLNSNRDEFDQQLPKEYEEVTSSLLQDIYSQIIISLELSKERMQQHYNKNVRYIDYIAGQKVWLKVKHYKTGENRKLAPRRDGPWTIVEKLPNGVNFRIEDSNKERKVVHHDRLLPVILNELSTTSPNQRRLKAKPSLDNSDQSSASDYSSAELECKSDSSGESDIEENHERLRPRRQIRTRGLSGTIPWSALKL